MTDSLGATSAPPAKIATRDLTVVYSLEAGRSLEVIHGLDLTIDRDEFVCLIGPSGCGKTTVLNVLAGLLRPTTGQVLLDGEPVTGPGRERGLVFQQDAIFPWRTVVRNVEYGLELRGVPKADRRRIAMEHLDLVGLTDSASFYPKELSGGMRKRVAIAMVFANQPAVLLMDEPFGALDYPTKVGLQKELLRIWEVEKRTTVFVTHDLEEAIYLSDRLVVMVKGEVARIIEVPFARPRGDVIRSDPNFQQLKLELWQYIM